MAISIKPQYIVRSIKKDISKVSSLKVVELVSVLKYLDTKYHTESKPLVSDTIYDSIRATLKIKSPNNTYFKKTGAKPARKKVRLPFYMPSLDKIKPDTDVLSKWLDSNKGPYVVADKLDGISLSILYRNGVPYKAYTRGDGRVGQDISHHIENLRIPKKIPTRKDFAVRCEVIMPLSTFQSRFSDKFENARNLVGGMVNTLQTDKSIRRTKVYVYEVLDGVNSNKKLSTQLETAKKYGFDVVPYKVVNTLDQRRLISILKRRKSSSKTAIDGLVVTQNTPHNRVRSGYPEYSIAFKMNMSSSMVQTTVKDVVWEVSKHNKLIPTIYVRPVNVGDITINKVSGHNAYYILHGYVYKDRHKGLPERYIGKGTKVTLVRSGDVIPYIYSVDTGAKEPLLPDIPYKISSSGIHFYVNDTKNTSSDIKKTAFFFSAMGIEGIKEATISRLFKLGMSFKDILHATAEDYMDLGIPQKTAFNIANNVKKGMSEATFVKVASASSVFGEGFGVRRLQSIYDTYPNILRMNKKDVMNAVLLIEGFGSITAEQFASRLPVFKRWVSSLGIKLKRPRKVVTTGSKMVGHNVVFTRVRDKQLEDWIKEQGGNVQTGIRKDTTILISKDKIGQSSKEQKAKEKGIEVITLADFYTKYKVKI